MLLAGLVAVGGFVGSRAGRDLAARRAALTGSLVVAALRLVASAVKIVPAGLVGVVDCRVAERQGGDRGGRDGLPRILNAQ